MSTNKKPTTARSYPANCCTSPYVAGFVEDLRISGYTPISVSFYRRGIFHLGKWADSAGIAVKSFDDSVISRFKKHLKRCRCNPRGRGILKPARLASELFLAHLRRSNIVAPAEQPVMQRSPIMEDFLTWMRVHRGASERTICTYEGALNSFFEKLGDDPTLWRTKAVRLYVLKRAKDHGRWDAKHLSNALRALLRFQVLRGHCRAGLDAIVPTVPHWRLSSLPRYLEPDVVERVLAACDRSTSHGLRDYAILLLLARLGLRAGDVMEMKIADINWSHGTITVRGKQRRESRLPLPQEVGNAVLAYLERGRPRVSLESMFLCMQAPYRPFVTSTPVAYVVKKALARAGVKDAPWQGAHLLRHSAATAMVRAGCTLETVATILRHKSMDTAAHYAKVDIGMLETVTQPWPTGASC